MRIFLMVLLCSLSITVQAKKKPSLKRADKYYKNTEYAKAADEYKRLILGRRTADYIYLQLADCYDRLNQDIEASRYYGKAIAQNDSTLKPDIYYKYAKVMEKNGRYEAAKDMMQQFVRRAPQDARAKDFLAKPDAHKDLVDRYPTYMFQESGLNHLEYDDFGAWLNPGDTLYFASNRTKHEKKIPRKIFEVRDKWQRKPNFDLYTAEFKGKDEPIKGVTRIKGRVNRRFNDGPSVISANGQRIYFASEAYRNRKFRKNDNVKHRDHLMSLFYAKKKKKKWKRVKPLRFTRAGFMYTSPALSPDGKFLYFASNMPGSYGELDIWRVALLEDDEFGKPENLGPVINSGTRNDYPFVSSDNKLYFSSDRWGGYGGMDVYVSDLNNLSNAPTNLGEPINTAKNDFAFSFYPDKNMGLFSSDRIGRTDIYKAFPLCFVEFRTMLKNKSFNTPVADAKVEFINTRRRVEDHGVSNRSGMARGEVKCSETYKIKVSHPDYLDEIIDITVNAEEGVQEIDVFLRPLEELVIGKDKIELGDIQFAFNQTEITENSKIELDKLVKVMKRYPSMRVKINSHSDSKGNPAYNLKLSNDRAKATLDYIVSQGIESSRLESQGYGSQELKVECEPCSEWEDAQNRRSEFIILQR
ncbi:outer membrane lipoprotein omp16 precursor [Myroides odoratimimus]|uniref:OmpA family protein n=1 Tax=Myroides TaxID=76831 RepID=UPI00072ADC35|nr:MULTISPECIES: OmpA family protein [Myroides]MDM1327912.1 PD40 domain-containing protein [Myroides odoratimimus]GAQ15844.1 outer membrane lipoprotein omp16 precursor [Myroides odoratimimus]STZ49104.1 Minor outer membrane protein Omp16 [Myroides odoratimimus]